MASKVLLQQNICGATTRSNLVKVGLGDSLNMYPETQDINSHSCQVVMRSASGEAEYTDYEFDGKCRGMFRVSRGFDGNPVLYAVFGNGLYLITSTKQVHKVADINTYDTEVRMCETGGYNDAHPHLMLVDGLECYAVDVTVPVATQRTDFRTIQLPHRPNDEYVNCKPTHIQYLFGYLVMTDQFTDAYYTSYLYPFETLDSNNEIDYDIWRVGSTGGIGFISFSDWCTDNTTGLIAAGSKFYTFGPRSWQAWSYNDDKNAPFTSPDNAAGTVGLLAVNSLCALGSSVFWLGSSDVGENGVFMLSGTQLTRISTDDIERELVQMTHPEAAYSSVWQEHHHVFYSLTFEESRMTYVYDVLEKAWHRRASYTGDNNLTYWRYKYATFAYNRTMVASDHKLCYMDENKYDEHDGRRILKRRRGSVITSNDQPFYIDSAEIICNNGQHSTKFANLMDGALLQPADDTELNPRISIRYSWDGATFSDYEDYYLGKIGQYEWSTVAWHLGVGRYFTLEISTTEKIAFSIQNLKIAWSPCGVFL